MKRGISLRSVLVVGTFVPVCLLAIVFTSDPAKAGPCDVANDPEYQRLQWALAAENTQKMRDGTLRVQRRMRLESVSADVWIVAPPGRSRSVDVVVDLLDRADHDLPRIGAKSLVPSWLTIVLADRQGLETPSGGRTLGWQYCDGTAPPGEDFDGDGITNLDDNCPHRATSDTTDTDGDGAGDWCDPRFNDPDVVLDARGQRTCRFTIFDQGNLRTGSRLEFFVAHEFFHVAQKLALESVSDCHAKWWTEGTAEWFAHRMVDGATHRQHWLDGFNQRSVNESLLELTYEAQAFFFWLGEVKGPMLPLELAEQGDAVLGDAGRVGQALGYGIWEGFLDALVSGEIEYPDGRPAIPDPYLGERTERPWAFEAPPLTFFRTQIETDPGDWILTTQSNARSLHVKEPGTDWYFVTPQPAGAGKFNHITECPGPDTISFAAVTLNGEDLSLRIQDRGDEDPCRCQTPIPDSHCLIGLWEAESTDAPSRFNEESAARGGPSRWTGQDMGTSRFAFRPDGTFQQVISRKTTSEFEHQVGAAKATQIVTVTNTANGRWSVPKEGELEICKDTFSGTMVNRLIIDGRQQVNGPMPIPYDPAAEERGGDYRFRCDGDSSEITFLVGGRPWISWTASRSAGKIPPPKSGGDPDD